MSGDIQGLSFRGTPCAGQPVAEPDRLRDVCNHSDNQRNFISDITCWASTQPDIKAVALVGSYARGTATEDSDIDLVMLVDHPGRYLEDVEWLKQFGSVENQQTEYYGLVTSLRVWYVGGREVEYGITTRHWAAVPLDEGTRQVIKGGMKVLFEREVLLSPHLHEADAFTPRV